MPQTNPIVLNLIEENKKTRNPKLDLSDQFLLHFPEEVLELEHLEALDLRSSNDYDYLIRSGRWNHIHTLPSTLKNLKRLKRLDLRGLPLNHLPQLPEQVLVFLDSATIQRTKTDGLLPKRLGIRLNVQTIDDLESWTAAYPTLEALDLSGCRLTSIPAHIAKLQNLTLLDLSYNQIQSIPEHIAKLKNLTLLDLSYNQIQSIPEHIAKLQNLTLLDLSYNQIQSIPEHIEKLQNLTLLDLRNNQIQSIPEHIEKLQNLTLLDLSSNQIQSIPEHIEKLQNLTHLYLSSNQIQSIPEHIEKLQNLTLLDLSGSPLKRGSISEIPEHIAKLQNLTLLKLSSNQIQSIPEHIEKLQNLTQLKLSDNQIQSIPEHIEKLQNLTHLYLSYNQIQSIPEHIEKLQNLTLLKLSSNQIQSIPEHIEKLQNLTLLDLRNNQIQSIPEHIEKLQNLTLLDLSYNQIQSIPEHIEKLQNLTKLDLSYNQIQSIPEHIEKLQNLTLLKLSSNQIQSIPEHIEKLQNLILLDLSYNQIQSIPEHIEKLQNLTLLKLSDNQIQSIPAHIAKLQNLTQLYLSYNQIKSIPEHIVKLQNLTQLYLSYNQIKSIPEHIVKLQNLTQLDLSKNQIQSIPEHIVKLQNLTHLKLGNNPIESPPPEIIEQGIQGIKNYFLKLSKGNRIPIFEAKLLIIGEPGAGKTSLKRKIIKRDAALPEPSESTYGIDIDYHQFPIHDGQNFKMNIWDFGGQEIYKSTHQFFLTERSLYILVAENRRQDTDFNYWLQIQELLGGTSPILILENQRDERKWKFDYPGLRMRFENIRDRLIVNLLSLKGFDLALKTIHGQISSLAHVGDLWPESWFQVRSELEKIKDGEVTFIKRHEYEAICKKYDLTTVQDFETLSAYLHDLGVFLHFSKDPVLKNLIILDNQWATNSVYRVLDANPESEMPPGRYTIEDLKEIWDSEEYKGYHQELTRLLINFRFAYQLETYPDEPELYIIPEKLPEDAPDYHWPENDNLVLRYKYEFMPKGMIPQFIVEMHDHLESIDMAWHRGAILNLEKDDPSNRADIVETYGSQGEIRIRAIGLQSRLLMSRIVAVMERKIHKRYKGLRYEKLVPCICPICLGSQTPHTYKYELLTKRLKDGEPKVQCDLSYKFVEVVKLLEGISPAYESEKRNRDSHDGRADVNIENEIHIHGPANIFQGEQRKVEIHQNQPDQKNLRDEKGSTQENSSKGLFKPWLNYLLIGLAIAITAISAWLLNAPAWAIFSTPLIAGLLSIFLIRYYHPKRRYWRVFWVTLLQITVLNPPAIQFISSFSSDTINAQLDFQTSSSTSGLGMALPWLIPVTALILDFCERRVK